MQYHTLSLSEHDYDVTVIATGGSQPLQAILDARNVRLAYLPEPPAWALRLPSLLPLLVKAAFQLLVMLWLMLARLPRPRAILLQNPPAIPTMLVCLLAAARHRAALIIDWHNLAYTILALKHGRHGWLIRLARAYEARLGALAAAHFTVTAAMQAFLHTDFGVAAAVLHDRPPAFFQPASLAEQHDLLTRLQPEIASTAIGAPVLQRHGLAGGGAGTRGAKAARAQPSIVAQEVGGAGSTGALHRTHTGARSPAGRRRPTHAGKHGWLVGCTVPAAPPGCTHEQGGQRCPPRTPLAARCRQRRRAAPAGGAASAGGVLHFMDPGRGFRDPAGSSHHVRCG
jgi:hypothetical protein